MKKSPTDGDGWIVLLAFVVAGTLGVGFSEIGGAVYSALKGLLAKVGVLS